ncbi:helix-turn-helix domain-containing protein, partial [Vibrio cholerae]
MNETKISANQVNEKSLQLLMQVAVNPEPVSAKGLSEQLQVPLSSLYRHLKLLKEWNLIEESPHDK